MATFLIVFGIIAVILIALFIWIVLWVGHLAVLQETTELDTESRLIIGYGNKYAYIDKCRLNKLITIIKQYELHDLKCFNCNAIEPARVDTFLPKLIILCCMHHGINVEERKQIISYLYKSDHNLTKPSADSGYSFEIGV